MLKSIALVVRNGLLAKGGESGIYWFAYEEAYLIYRGELIEISY